MLAHVGQRLWSTTSFFWASLQGKLDGKGLTQGQGVQVSFQEGLPGSESSSIETACQVGL